MKPSNDCLTVIYGAAAYMTIILLVIFVLGTISLPSSLSLSTFIMELVISVGGILAIKRYFVDRDKMTDDQLVVLVLKGLNQIVSLLSIKINTVNSRIEMRTRWVLANDAASSVIEFVKQIRDPLQHERIKMEINELQSRVHGILYHRSLGWFLGKSDLSTTDETIPFGKIMEDLRKHHPFDSNLTAPSEYMVWNVFQVLKYRNNLVGLEETRNQHFTDDEKKRLAIVSDTLTPHDGIKTKAVTSMTNNIATFIPLLQLFYYNPDSNVGKLFRKAYYAQTPKECADITEQLLTDTKMGQILRMAY